ncbi:cilia- and flagella-associated protein 251 [Bombina bombina]|uniref:cilia- and flagella-associated protein 251 n=1 Tax=Bombina bombina TaxID=8345 RepID=UPI00235AF129|nr:cilia- and flagella-associated protein 251 [Bombina bombina]
MAEANQESYGENTDIHESGKDGHHPGETMEVETGTINEDQDSYESIERSNNQLLDSELVDAKNEDIEVKTIYEVSVGQQTDPPEDLETVIPNEHGEDTSEGLTKEEGLSQADDEEEDNAAVVPFEDVDTTTTCGKAEDNLQQNGNELTIEHPEQKASVTSDQEQTLQLQPEVEIQSEDEKPSENDLQGNATEIPSVNKEADQVDDSLVYTATPRTVFEDTNATFTDKPLNLSWSYGMNNTIPVYNLHAEDQQVIVYVCAHTAVIHDFQQNRQRHLQGHCSCISCMCMSEDKRWIATADQGPDSLIIVWDSFSGIPVHTIFDSHPEGGVINIAMSQNAKYLATIGGETNQKVCIWDWTTGEQKPVCSVALDPQFGLQKYILFNPQDHTQLITNSETQVVFYAWVNASLDYVAPALDDKTFNKIVGEFSQSVFDFSAKRAMTGTFAGNLVVWETTCPASTKGKLSIQPHNKKALKLMHLQKDGITVLTVHDRYFVTGDVRGHVKFYDQRLQLVNWYSHFNLDSIRSISFSTCPPTLASDKTKYPQDCSIRGDQFAISNFIVSTSNAVVLQVYADGTRLKKCLQDSSEAVHALACHPCKTQIAIGNYNGVLKIWDYKNQSHVISRIFGNGKRLQCISFDPKGFLLAAGFTDGSIQILDTITLADEIAEPFKYASVSITHIHFSPDSQYLVTADEDFTVTLFKLVTQTGGATWQYFGRYRSHYKPIQSLIFGVKLDSDEPRLLSLGTDRILVEYDLVNSSKDHLSIASSDRTEQSAVPQCLAWYPPITKECFLLVANDQYKMKLYNATTKMCRKTLLGPAFGSPVRKMEVLSLITSDTNKAYLAYITDDKVGLQILPVDGNPHKSTALICHPDGVSNLACSHDGQYLFTAGGKDCAVMMWKTNLQSLEAVASLGGDGLTPFYGLLQGGQDGTLFKELEDYFYYAQLRSQGIDTMEARNVSTHIPLKEIPFIMRALGFYPSEQEVENMLNEVKFSEYVDTGKQVTEINLGDFIKLYINHRPAFGINMKEVEYAFQVLGFSNEKKEPIVSRGALLQLLQTKGEHMTEEELAEYLSTLLGLNPEGGSSELSNHSVIGAAELFEQEIPEEITTHMFTAEILGLPIHTVESYEEHPATDLVLS